VFGKLYLLPLLYQFSSGKSLEQPFQPSHPFSEIGDIPSEIADIRSHKVDFLL